jgi:hypothetical protein
MGAAGAAICIICMLVCMCMCLGGLALVFMPHGDQ